MVHLTFKSQNLNTEVDTCHRLLYVYISGGELEIDQVQAEISVGEKIKSCFVVIGACLLVHGSLKALGVCFKMG